MSVAQNLARHDVGLILKASRDKATGGGVFPRVPDQAVAAGRFEPITLSPTATLYSYTVIHPNPKTGEKPFTLVYADFPEEVRVFGRLVLRDGERPTIGMTLQVVPAGPAADSEAYLFVAASEHSA